MSSWAKNRRLLYASIVVIFLVGAIGLPAFFILYKAPTCFDGVKNGDELGVDCGGSCERLCQSAFAPPIVDWTRFQLVSPGKYNIATYIENTNIGGEAIDAPYSIAIYDGKGVLVTEQKGTVTLPPHRNTLAFMPYVDTGKIVPVRAVFEFVSPGPQWHKSSDALQSLLIVKKDYSEDAVGSSLSVTLANSSVNAIGRISVYVVLYDKDGNAIGFSKTEVDGIAGKGTAIAPFTWPMNLGGKVISIEVLPVAE